MLLEEKEQAKLNEASQKQRKETDPLLPRRVLEHLTPGLRDYPLPRGAQFPLERNTQSQSVKELWLMTAPPQLLPELLPPRASS